LRSAPAAVRLCKSQLPRFVKPLRWSRGGGGEGGLL